MINIDEVTENQKLKELLKKMYEDNSSELENEILEEIIMKVNFLSYVNLDETETDFGNINFNVLTTDDNKIYLPAFTDLEELSKWGIPANMDTITLNLKKERLKVNEIRIETNSKILISEPKQLPTMMMDAIKDCCDSLENVNKAWILEMITEKDKSWLLILDFEGDKNYIFSKISQATRNYLGNMYLDMLPYEDDFTRNSVQNHKAFYNKNK